MTTYWSGLFARYASTTSLIAPATRFFAYGHDLFASACAFSAPTRPSAPRLTITPATSGRAASVVNWVWSVAFSAAVPVIRAGSVRITVLYPPPAAAPGAVPMGATLPQVPPETEDVRWNACVSENAPFRPLTRTYTSPAFDQVLALMLSSAVPSSAETAIRLRVCALEKASALNCDGLNCDGLNCDGLNAPGLNWLGLNWLGLNWTVRTGTG